MKLPAGRHLNDLALFAATVAVAAWQDWSVTDLVWSLWVSSLLVGYAFVATALLVDDRARDEGRGGADTRGGRGPAGGGTRAGGRDLDEGDGDGEGRLQGLEGPARSVAALLLLAFFTVHFGFFHYGHSLFLNEFFPLVEPAPTGGSTFMGPVEWGSLVATAVGRYWPFLLATAASRRVDFSGSVERAPEARETLFRPYRNVIRMHVLIFVFAGLDAAGLSGWAVYPVLFFYFFPLGAVRALFRGEAAAPA